MENYIFGWYIEAGRRLNLKYNFKIYDYKINIYNMTENCQFI